MPGAPVPIGDRRASACIRVDEITAEMDARRARSRHGRQESTADVVRSAPVIVSIDGAYKEYGRGDAVVAALQDVSVTVPPGRGSRARRRVRLGQDHSGRCLVGLESITRGNATVFGIDITQGTSMSKEDRAAWHSKVQYVFQDPYSSLNPRMTVEQTLAEAIRQCASTGSGGEPRSPRCSNGSVCDLSTRVVVQRPCRAENGNGWRSAGRSRSTRAADLRRAGVRAGRLGAGADPQPAQRHPARHRYRAAVHLARPRGRAADSRLRSTCWRRAAWSSQAPRTSWTLRTRDTPRSC
ncbi:hypothetical protein [Aeromicrobium sp. UC242_57]|uniref:hypothetical protein n=1 Tax=Aeromicrobium sp. UC242_57 TaxID=3374624 RepID=UPI0037B2094A